MAFQKSWKQVPKMNAAETTDRVRRMVQRESRGWGDVDNAIRRLSDNSGIGFWTLWHLYQKRAKTVNADLRDRIDAFYHWYSASVQDGIADFRDSLAAEAEGSDDDLSDLQHKAAALAAEAAALVAEIAARKARRRQ